MSFSNQELERMQQEFASFSERAAEDTCPRPEEIWEAVRADSSPDQRRRIVDHTSTCGSCAMAWRLAKQVTTSEAEPVKKAPVVSFPRRAYVPMAAAAAVLLTFGLVFVDRWNAGIQTRGGEPAAIESLLEQNSQLPRTRFLLRWRLEPGTQIQSYDLRVTTDDFQPVDSADDLQETQYLIPQEKLASFPAAQKLFWQVSAELADGEIVRSPTYVVRIRD